MNKELKHKRRMLMHNKKYTNTNTIGFVLFNAKIIAIQSHCKPYQYERSYKIHKEIILQTFF